MVGYARRQQLRRVKRGASRGVLAAVALALAVLVAGAGTLGLSLALLVLAGGLAAESRRAVRLAARSRVGAESEADVRRVLERLVRDGWQVRHAVDWPGRGDLDHVVRAPTGIGFVIETKTLRWTRAHLARTSDEARWLARRRHRYPRGVVPVLCVSRARHVQQVADGVLVVSLDRLVPSLRVCAVCGRRQRGERAAVR
jgi:hypothetical protein